MLPTQRRLLLCTGIVTLTVLMLLLVPDWSRPPTSAYFGHAPLEPTVTAAAAGTPHKGSAPRGGRARVCPAGRFVTINPTGRLGNKLCQYASLWSLQLDESSARPAWTLPEMHRALTPLFPGLTLPVLSDTCASRSHGFWSVDYSRYDRYGPGPPKRPVLLSAHPCDLTRFNRHRAALLQQLTFREDVRKVAQRRLRHHTAPLCRSPQRPPCTYIAVHVRRSDYGPLLRQMYNGTLAGETYLRRALALCRRRYRRPVFVVSSDDLAWVRRRLGGPDVVVAGSRGARAAGRDLALLAQCNHTVMTHGTFGFMAAFLARGDVVVPTGFGKRDSYLTGMMRQSGFNLTAVPVS